MSEKLYGTFRIVQRGNSCDNHLMTAVLSSPPAARRAGRPRSEATRRSILEATIRLLDTESVQTLTIEAIAREAGVGKATIYRWWDSKALVVIDAFIEHHIVKTPMRRDRPPADALAEHFAALVREYAGWSGRIVAQIIAEGQSDPVVLRVFREQFQEGRRAVVREVLDQWRSEGAIVAPDDLDLLSDLIYAPVYMRLLVGHAPLDASFVKAHLEYVYRLLMAQPRTKAKERRR
jgi:AcrR family transcriptional regulator